MAAMTSTHISGARILSGTRIFSVAAVALALVAAPAAATVRDGVDAWQKGDYASAVAQWKGPAAAGDADAQFNLAQAYKLGRGVPLDLGVAQSWFRKAAEQGHEQAQANLGLILFQQGDRAGAMPWLQKSADRGEPRAQYVVGTALFNGDLLARDWPRAYALMTQAAASGLPQAKASLQQMDKYLSSADREKGLQMAQTIARQTAAAAPATKAPEPASPRAAPRAPIATAAIPPSLPASAPAGPSAAKPKPAAPAAALASAGGRWKIQLGAYGAEGGAQTAWRTLTAKAPQLASLQPSYARAGAVTRLQAGPLGSKAAADKACAAARSAGAACFPVAP